ncbi:MAG: sigma-70 family RNA polymerase sigma factor [Dehalococcoidia bacterium]|nr:sigma-70 family RNA polymerase sigma factor [Dehalococcoidia bacterium]
MHSFSQLIEVYIGRAYRIAFAVLGSRCDAEDAVQEACLRAVRCLNQLEQDDRFEFWFARIVANCSRNLLRRSKRRRAAGSVPVEEAANLLANDGGVNSVECSMDLRRCVSQLPELHRLVVHLHYAEELTTGEIAYVLSRPQGTIRRLLSESYGMLRHSMRGNA